jgi:hypothetical protein
MSDKYYKDGKSFYIYLNKKFNTLNECIDWYNKWKKTQYIPHYGLISLRAMAAHCSNVLEKKAYKDNFFTFYINTKYGSSIYFGEKDK